MAATGASGTTAVRYGTMRENVLGLTVVLADGRVIHTGTRARKSSAGYDLTRLLVGSEGTLGVITESHAAAAPAARSGVGGGLRYPAIDGAVNTVIATIQLGMPGRAHRAARRGPDGRHQPVFEARLSRCSRRSSSSSTATRAPRRRSGGQPSRSSPAEHGGPGFEWATQPEDRARLWKARHDACMPRSRSRPGSRAWTTDVCVPISRLADCIAGPRRRTATRPSLPVCLVGHAGDGNFHHAVSRGPGEPGGAGRSQTPQRADGRTGRWRWAAPAAASTGSDSGRCATSAEHGEGLAGHARHQAGAGSRESHESREDPLAVRGSWFARSCK